ncbi:MAG: C13 family peptidase [Candidatus Hodarchaeota archaeon]
MEKKYLTYILLLIILISSISFREIENVTNEITMADFSSTKGNECADAWIIIGGDRSDHEAWDLVLLTTEWVYDVILACGYTDDDIYYLVPEIAAASTNREDALTTQANIETAIRTWAPTKVSANGALGLYLHDHGGGNFMCIPQGFYTATEFDNDLDQFEAASGCDRVFIIYEACSSGSFLDEPSQSDRIILTSTDPDHSAWWSPISPHISMFGEALFLSIQAGNSIGDAFEDATAQVIALGYGQVQYPCIEDNHDGVGHIVNAWGCLPSTGDGNDAKNTYICTNCPSIKFIPAFFVKIPIKIWIKFIPGVVRIPLTVKVDNTTAVKKVSCRIIPENWAPPPSRDNETMGRWDPNEDSYQWDLKPTGDGNYSGIIEITSPVNNSNYNLCFIVEDENGYKGPIVPTQVGLNENGTAPPDSVDPTVAISNPADGDILEGKVNITARGNDDNSGLAEIQIYVDGELKDTTTMPEYLPYPEAIYELDTTEYADGDLNITAKAIDNANNSQTHSITVEVNNTAETSTTETSAIQVSTIETTRTPGFQMILVVIGCLFVAMTIHIKKNRKRRW